MIYYCIEMIGVKGTLCFLFYRAGPWHNCSTDSLVALPHWASHRRTEKVAPGTRWSFWWGKRPIGHAFQNGLIISFMDCKHTCIVFWLSDFFIFIQCCSSWLLTCINEWVVFNILKLKLSAKCEHFFHNTVSLHLYSKCEVCIWFPYENKTMSWFVFFFTEVDLYQRRK